MDSTRKEKLIKLVVIYPDFLCIGEMSCALQLLRRDVIYQDNKISHH
jgi:hypothetical protein